jgi:hypothetical protein
MASAQIAFTLPDAKKKSLLQKQLAADGLTTKSFFSFCVDGYLNQRIRIGVLPVEENSFENLSQKE